MATQNRIGDLYEIDLGEGRFGFFHYLCRDPSQLGSHVIAAFEGIFDEGCRPDAAKVAGLGTKFHAHVFLKVGQRLSVWKKVGKLPVPPLPDIVFRCSADFGDPSIKVSNRWYVWRIGEEYGPVGPLAPQHFAAEWGPVVNPFGIRDSMLTGSYNVFQHDYARTRM